MTDAIGTDFDESVVTLVVLAGGKGARLGADKSRIRIHGKPILLDLAARLAWRGPLVLIKSNQAPSLPGEAIFPTHLHDQFPSEGPLGGIVTAIQLLGAGPQAARPRGPMIVLPIDLPHVDRSHLMYLIEHLFSSQMGCFGRFDASGKQWIEPLPMWISPTAMPGIARHFHAGRRSLRSLFQSGVVNPDSANPAASRVAVVACPSQWSQNLWLNLNHPQDLASIGATLDE